MLNEETVADIRIPSALIHLNTQLKNEHNIWKHIPGVWRRVRGLRLDFFWHSMRDYETDIVADFAVSCNSTG